MVLYRTPGVHFEWLDTRPQGIGPRRTDIAGFVGIAAKGPLHQPIKVESWTQFISTFGGHIPQGYLAYAVEGFFANGGQICWVVRVADPDQARPVRLDLLDNAGEPTLRLTASSPGVWGEKIVISVLHSSAASFSLMLRLPDSSQELWRDLSMQQGDPRYVAKVCNDPQLGSRLVRVQDRSSPSAFPQNRPRQGTFRLHEGASLLGGGQDGLETLRPNHFSGEGAPPDQPWGLAALEGIDDVSIVMMPDIMVKRPDAPQTKPPLPRCDVLDSEPSPAPASGPATEFPPTYTPEQISILQQALIAHCEKLKDRVAILDLPPGLVEPRVSHEQVIQWRNQFDTKYAALYYPWLLVPDPLRLNGLLRAIPPSGHVAGIYARGDLRVGVHKPPANEVVNGANDVSALADDIGHGYLNERDVNVIRPFNGRDLRVAGARTLSSDPQWRYVNVRRLLIMIEEAIDESTQWTVFEPNNRDLWRQIDRSARSFLDRLWQRGMLDGATAEEAYSVQCDEATNSPQETEDGQMICLIGVLPPWPAEFVVVRIGKTEGGTEILEATRR
jgi:Bacteriophage tail sheath protein